MGERFLVEIPCATAAILASDISEATMIFLMLIPLFMLQYARRTPESLVKNGHYERSASPGVSPKKVLNSLLK
jgi:hypothetical protein